MAIVAPASRWWGWDPATPLQLLLAVLALGVRGGAPGGLRRLLGVLLLQRLLVPEEDARAGSAPRQAKIRFNRLWRGGLDPIGKRKGEGTNLSRRCSGVRPSPPFLELGFRAAARSRSRSLWLPRARPQRKKSRRKQIELDEQANHHDANTNSQMQTERIITDLN